MCSLKTLENIMWGIVFIGGTYYCLLLLTN